MTTLLQLAVLLAPLKDPVPDDKDVVAGWGGFAGFIGLALAVAFLGWSLVRQLRRAKQNAEAGVFGPEDVPRQPAEGQEEDVEGRREERHEQPPGGSAGAP
jgi:hypothetical protein